MVFSGGAKQKVYLALKALFTFMALIAGIAELWGLPAFVTEFEIIGFGQWFRCFTGFTLIVGAVLLSLKNTAGFGAALIFAICIGAFFAQLLVLHGDVVHTIVPALVLAGIVWVERHQIGKRLGQ